MVAASKLLGATTDDDIELGRDGFACELVRDAKAACNPFRFGPVAGGAGGGGGGCG